MDQPDTTGFDALDDKGKAYVDAVAEVLYLDSIDRADEPDSRSWHDLVETAGGNEASPEFAVEVARHRALALRIVRALTRRHDAAKAAVAA